MGAWDVDPFANDAALDWRDDFLTKPERGIVPGQPPVRAAAYEANRLGFLLVEILSAYALAHGLQMAEEWNLQRLSVYC